ncbi:MAG TPA: hypothetical protein VFX49_22990 [Chloroflexota bacterium]|nr:hypothetical protein [Chloroflexota bacterium]
MKKRSIVIAALSAPLAAACGGEAQKAVPTTMPAAAPPVQPTAVPMANKIILFGDMALFDNASNPENCVLKSRYRRGEGVGFRMSAIYPLTGEFAETAELTVKLANGETIPMRWRGTGNDPRKWLWTAKWVVPETAPIGIMKYTVDAKDKEGRTGSFAPFDVQASQLTIVA